MRTTTAHIIPARHFRRWPMRLIGPAMLVLLIAITSLTSACGSGLSGEVEYQPTILPVKFAYNGSTVDIKGSKEIVTFIGTFSIGAKYTLPENDAP